MALYKVGIGIVINQPPCLTLLAVCRCAAPAPVSIGSKRQEPDPALRLARERGPPEVRTVESHAG